MPHLFLAHRSMASWHFFSMKGLAKSHNVRFRRPAFLCHFYNLPNIKTHSPLDIKPWYLLSKWLSKNRHHQCLIQLSGLCLFGPLWALR